MAVKDDVFALAEPLVQSLGMQLVDVEYAKEGPRWVVRVYLFRPEGVGLEDCRSVSEALEPILEAEDPVKTPYHLEVSSPGAERVLKNEREFKIFQGHWAKAAMRQPIEGEYAFYGRLGPVTDTTVVLNGPDGTPRSLPREQVKQLRLALESEAGKK